MCHTDVAYQKTDTVEAVNTQWSIKYGVWISVWATTSKNNTDQLFK